MQCSQQLHGRQAAERQRIPPRSPGPCLLASASSTAVPLGAQGRRPPPTVPAQLPRTPPRCGPPTRPPAGTRPRAAPRCWGPRGALRRLPRTPAPAPRRWLTGDAARPRRLRAPPALGRRAEGGRGIGGGGGGPGPRNRRARTQQQGGVGHRGALLRGAAGEWGGSRQHASTGCCPRRLARHAGTTSTHQRYHRRRTPSLALVAPPPPPLLPTHPPTTPPPHPLTHPPTHHSPTPSAHLAHALQPRQHHPHRHQLHPKQGAQAQHGPGVDRRQPLRAAGKGRVHGHVREKLQHPAWPRN